MVKIVCLSVSVIKSNNNNNNNNNNFILTPDSEVKLLSVVFTITITYSKTSRVKNCQYIHKLPILF